MKANKRQAAASRRLIGTVVVVGALLTAFARWEGQRNNPFRDAPNAKVASGDSDVAAPTPETAALLAACRESGRVSLQAMHASAGVDTSNADGWHIVRTGAAYDNMDRERRHRWVQIYSDGDACVYGGARKLEFQSPRSEVFARVDRLRGIRMVN